LFSGVREQNRIMYYFLERKKKENQVKEKRKKDTLIYRPERASQASFYG